MHADQHPLAGKNVRLDLAPPGAPDVPADATFLIEDWWDRVTGGSWMDAQGNPAALKYAMRSGFARLPLDNEVVYGKVGHLGHLVHVSELGEVVP